jgi:hypothetical protein
MWDDALQSNTLIPTSKTYTSSSVIAKKQGNKAMHSIPSLQEGTMKTLLPSVIASRLRRSNPEIIKTIQICKRQDSFILIINDTFALLKVWIAPLAMMKKGTCMR